ncbi:MAG: Crp/Fnr family transcriptional regulator [Schwartzia sp.]|jgi:CRP-like cAMP-binding protein|nr:Crp/Fnr family transcriptional regulator [Schwartzia sp. (in: firmicutes)]MBP3690610.1 Crp/Fnr family transcriptional regulator [Schwartzia sp. (in: firmicutes)]MBQ4422031.1 Crp/Fnr family transcriptional regulator [Schwartzia sp. (in: firmicutes)]MBR1553756.1 Crp/Fnr family transcriptional regulator [Schwartzia sp. (in: firmicutes)]MBR5909012.1 Crp/Fnr family transcriptional regulator [Schwartzia sp. (in: firmicutes)]
MAAKHDEDFMAALHRCSLTDGMDEAGLRAFLASGDVRRLSFPKGAAILREGETLRAIYILLSGSVQILKNTFSGRRILLSEIDEPGDMFGEVYFVLREPCGMTVEAVRDTELLAVSSAFFSIDSNSPSGAGFLVQRNLMRVFARKAYFMHRKLQVLSSGGLRERLIRFLFQRMKPDGTAPLPMSREQLADELAVTRPSLSRELSRLQKEAVLRLEGKTVRVLDMARFEEYL